jgi:tetratricopeptide (TPR) repeat protein
MSITPTVRLHNRSLLSVFWLLVVLGSQSLSWASAPIDTSQVVTLIDASLQQVAISQDSAVVLAHQALRLAKVTAEPRLVSAALRNLGFLYYRWSVLDSAQIYHEQALKLSRSVGDRLGEGLALNRLGNIAWLDDRQAEARRFYEQALAVHQSLDDAKETGRSLNNLAVVHREWGDYQQAIRLFLDARQAYVAADYVEGQAWLDFSLAILYKKLEEYDRALASIQKSLESYRELAGVDSSGVMICYGQLGDIYLLKGDVELGLDYQLRALGMRERTGVQPAVADGHTGVGKAYYALGELDQAERHFRRSEAIRANIDGERGRSTNLLYLGRIYRDRKDLVAARDYFERALALSRQLQERDKQSEILWALSELHAQTGDFLRAWSTRQTYDEVQELVMSAEISKRVASLQLQHEIDTQVMENERLERENRIKDLQLDRSHTQTALVVVAALFIFVTAMVVLYLQRKRAQINTLKGLIPICAHCKKIRNDAGYYEQLEKYISEHSEAQFSHGICQDCASELYGEYLNGGKGAAAPAQTAK